MKLGIRRRQGKTSYFVHKKVSVSGGVVQSFASSDTCKSWVPFQSRAQLPRSARRNGGFISSFACRDQRNSGRKIQVSRIEKEKRLLHLNKNLFC